MPSARIWRCVKQKIAGAAAKRTLPPRVLQKGVSGGILNQIRGAQPKFEKNLGQI